MTCQVRKSKTIAALLGLAGLLLLLCMGSPQRASAAACDTTWVGGDGNWNEETNWSDGIPGGDRPNVCVTQNGTYTITVGATFDQPASGANIAHLTLGGTSGTQTIDVRGTNLSGTPVGAAINIGGGTINSHGALTLRSTDANAGASICTGNPGIDSDGVINFEGLGNRVLQGAINSTGTVNVRTNLTVPGVHSCGFNGLNIQGGSLNIAAAKTLTVDENFAQSGGTTRVNGKMAVAGIFTMTGGTFTGKAPVLDALPMTASGGTGAFVLHGQNSYQSSIGANIDLTIEGTATEDAALIGGGAAEGAINRGAIHLTSTNAAHGASMFASNNSPGSLTNRGLIETVPGAGGGRTIGNGITNVSVGTIHIGRDTTGSALRLANAGQITVDPGATFAMDGTPFQQTGGTTAVNGALIRTMGPTTVTGGTFTGNPVVLQSPQGFSPIAGSGSFVVHGGGSLASNVGSGFEILVEGTAADDASLSWTSGANPATNNGAISLTSTDAAHGASLFSPDNSTFGGLTNRGTIDVMQGAGGNRTLGQGMTNAAGGTMLIRANTNGSCCSGALSLLNAGTLRIAAGKTFSLGGSRFTQTGGTTFVNGQLTGEGNSRFEVTGGKFTGNPPVLTSKIIAPSGGTGTFVFHGSGDYDSDIGRNVTVIVEATAAENATLNGRGTAEGATNRGTVLLTSTDPGHNAALNATSANPGSLVNAGTIETRPGSGGGRSLFGGIRNTPTGNLLVNQDTGGSFLRIVQQGILTVAAGKTLSFGEPLTQTHGTTTVDGTLSNGAQPYALQGGTLRGTGNVTTSTLNNTGGTVHPGASPGILTITGNYTQSAGGTLAAEVSGTTPGAGYSRLAVSGNATLAGELDVTNTSAVPLGSQLQVVTAGGTVSGTFGTVDVHGAPNYSVAYNPANVTLTAQ